MRQQYRTFVSIVKILASTFIIDSASKYCIEKSAHGDKFVKFVAFDSWTKFVETVVVEILFVLQKDIFYVDGNVENAFFDVWW